MSESVPIKAEGIFEVCEDPTSTSGTKWKKCFQMEWRGCYSIHQKAA